MRRLLVVALTAALQTTACSPDTTDREHVLGHDEHDSKAEARRIFQAQGEVSQADGLKAWDRIHAVVSHPRCSNCHVGPDNVPLWAIAGEHKTRAHGMRINAGVSRQGTETLPCATCHATSTAESSPTPHLAPHAGIPWQLAPLEMQWVGKSSAEICAQVRDPARNGGRDAVGLVEHPLHDFSLHGFIRWSWSPGGGRETPPGTFDEHVRDMARWAAAGMPCPAAEQER